MTINVCSSRYKHLKSYERVFYYIGKTKVNSTKGEYEAYLERQATPVNYHNTGYPSPSYQTFKGYLDPTSYGKNYISCPRQERERLKATNSIKYHDVVPEGNPKTLRRDLMEMKKDPPLPKISSDICKDMAQFHIAAERAGCETSAQKQEFGKHKLKNGTNSMVSKEINNNGHG